MHHFGSVHILQQLIGAAVQPTSNGTTLSCPEKPMPYSGTGHLWLRFQPEPNTYINRSSMATNTINLHTQTAGGLISTLADYP
ncbi:hypothetical protein GN956_G18743 [Arapaima gigas]